MKERMIESVCPKCHHTFWIKRDTLIIAGIHPLVQERLEDGTYFMHRCSQCHTLYQIQQPLLYRNPEQGFILALTASTNIPSFPEEKEVIVCRSPEDFLFCFKVKEQGLNLSLVKKKKKQLEHREGCSLRFDTYDETNHCLWFLNKQKPIGIRLSLQEQSEIIQ